MFQFHVKQYGLQGNGAGPTGSLPYQLILRVVGVSEASPKNVWLDDCASILAAKAVAVAIFASMTPSLTTAGGNYVQGATVASDFWTDTPSTSGAVESLSAVFTAF